MLISLNKCVSTSLYCTKRKNIPEAKELPFFDFFSPQVLHISMVHKKDVCKKDIRLFVDRLLKVYKN